MLINVKFLYTNVKKLNIKLSLYYNSQIYINYIFHYIFKLYFLLKWLILDFFFNISL